jgi:hypothetical protein
MNLIQVQDRLKDMPTQAIMSYANGSNPEVPPYLALGELNRRKQMEQKHAEAPQGTVKDQIEQSVKLAQAQKAAQAQGQQKMTEAMGGQQNPVPSGTPQPEGQPEAGIAQLPTGPMNFRDGGIVSFDGENASLVDQNMPSDEESQFMKDLRKFGRDYFVETEEQKARRMEQQKTMAQGDPLKYFTQSASEYEKNKKARELAKQNVLPSDLDPSRYIPESTDRAPTSTADVNAVIGQAAGAQRGPSAGPRPPSAGGAGGPSAGGRAPSGAPQAGAPAQDDDLAMLRKMRDELKAPTPIDRDAERAAFAKTNPYLNTPAGSKLEELYTQIAKRDEEDRARFLKNEEERKQGRLNRGLLAGAEATRGQGGIGALGSFFMGYGKAGEAEDEAARTRTDAQRAMERQQEVLRAEVLDKIESARRAEARGDFATAIQDKKDAATASAQFAQNKFTMQQHIATAAEAKRHNMSVEAYQQAQLQYAKAAANKGPEIEQIYNFIRKNRDDLSPAQAYAEAVSLSRSGIAGAKLDADIQHKAEQEFAKDPLTPGLAQKVNMARLGKNKAEIKAAEDAYQAHKKDFYKNKNLPLPEGSGGTAGDSTAGFSIKSERPTS